MRNRTVKSVGARCLGAAVALSLVAAACSEPEPESTSSDPATTDAPTTDASTDDTATTDAPVDTTPATDDAGDDGDGDDGDDGDGDGDTAATDPAATDDGSIVFQFAGQPWFMGEVPANAVAADESLEPIKLGMINQENTPLGSFPEVRAAAEAAVAWVNDELGGVGGRPIELHTCVTTFDVEQSQACAQELVQKDVIALVGGVDVTSNGSYPVIEQNDLPVLGGIPANLVEQRSPNAFFFSGGGAGSTAAFIGHAIENGAETIAIAYAEFESFEVAARDYGQAVGEALGATVELIPFSLVATDYLPVITKAQEVGADAFLLLAADAACVPVMQITADLELDMQLYLTGACAGEAIGEAAGEAAIGVLYNSEGPVTVGDVEGEIFEAVTEKYSTEPAFGAGTVGFRGFMNLYALMDELGPDGVSSEALTELARQAVDRPSFWGHEYTCDGNQVPGLPALCAPQQVLFTIPSVGSDLVGVGGWIETDQIFAATIG